MTRASDSDNSVPGQMAPGDTVWVAFGDTQQYTTWTQTAYGTGDSSGGILIGIDPITYVQVSGAGSYNGDGSTISISGSIISIAPGYVGQTSITTLGTISSGTWNGSTISTTYGGTGSSLFTPNGILYGNGTSPVQVTSASATNGAILTTASSGGVPAFSNTLQGQYIINNNSNSTSSTSGALSIAGGLGVSGNVFFGSNLNVTSAANFGSNVGVGSTVNISGGLGVTGSVLFRSSVIIQSGGLGVTGGIVVSQGGLGVTGAAVFSSSITAGSLSLSTPLPISSGGTGLGTTSIANYILGMNNSSLGLEYKQLIQGSNVTITHSTNSVTIAASASATPGGPNNAIQYNSSGSFAGSSTFVWDNSSQRIDIKNINSIGTGTTTGFILQNSTASTVSAQLQFSPGLEFIGRAWKTSGSPATDTLVRYHQMVEATSGASPSGILSWKSAIHNAANQGPTYISRAEISTIYGLGIYETTGVYKSSFINSSSATTDIYYTLPNALPASNQVLLATGISGSSVTLQWGSTGTVNSGVSGALAYYPSTGTVVDDAGAIIYSSSTTHLVITSQTATDIPLRLDGNASSSVNLFQVRKGTTDRFVINSNGDVSIASSVDSTSSTTGALTITGGVGIGSSVYVSGNITANRTLTITQTTEKFNNFTSNIASGGTVTFNSITAGNILYVNTGTVSGNWTLDVTNLSLTSGFSSALVVSIFQDATAYMPTVLKIDGVTQTVIWQGGGGVPTGNANKYDFVNYSILCTASSTYVVFGQLVSFG